MSNIVIDIAAEFTGNKSFKQAESATDKLGKNVKKLAGALGLALGGQQILAFGKAAVKAAAADEKAQKQLALALKNVGLERDAASTEAYIQRLQSEFGILDDKLRPAYQNLVVAVQDSDKAQRLLNLSLDIAASTGKDLGSVTSALSRAYLGNNAALSKLGVGISKADLKAGKFEDIISQLEGTFAGSAQSAANTFQGSIDKLGVAAANASEIIGTGLIDALKGLGDQDSVDNLAKSMQDAATYTADVIRGIGVLIEKLKGLPGIGALDIGMIPILGTYLEMLNAAGKAAKGGNGIAAQGLAHLAELQARYTSAILKDEKKITKEDQKQLKDARLKAAIDKANLALNKGSDVFDMDKIQIAAALTNQAEQLGKATTSSQLLQIANDTARLNVKQSILALEDAIAAKDEAAIVAATAKLNADLKVLGALGMQNIKLQDIKSILDTLKPKDLVNLTNLDAALAKIQEMLRLLAQANAESKSKAPTSGSLGSGIPISDYIPPIPISVGTTASIDALIEASEAIQTRANAFAELLDQQSDFDELALNEYIKKLGLASSASSVDSSSTIPVATAAAIQSGNRYAAQAAASYNITIQSGVGDPEAIARAVEDVIRQANQRGTTSLSIG
jgi:hypothetical protein